MDVVVNGTRRDLAGGTTVDTVVNGFVGPARAGIAVALNGTVLPAARWAGTMVADGDELEILTAIQGG